MTATPLQMAMVSAGIANEGIVMNPRMVDSVIGADLSVQQTFEDTEFGRALEPRHRRGAGRDDGRQCQ